MTSSAFGRAVLAVAILFTPTVVRAEEHAGAEVVDRPNVDTSVNFVLMDTFHPITWRGTVTRWQVYARGTGRVQLVILRRRGTTNAADIVGRSAVVTTQPNLNTFSVNPPILVQPGDM